MTAEGARYWAVVAGGLLLLAALLGAMAFPILVVSAQVAGGCWFAVVVPLSLLAMLIVGAWLLDSVDRPRRRIPGRCPACNYHLHGLDVTSGCPECGWGRQDS